MDKYYISYNRIHQLIQQSAATIAQSGFKPDFILAIGGGGFIPARILRTFLKVPIHTVSINFYEGDQAGSTPVTTQWLDESRVDINNKKILVVDEVDDTRATLNYCLQQLLDYQPAELGIFVLHHKRKEKTGNYDPAVKHVFVGEDIEDRWICYPWDATDIEQHDQLQQ